LPVILPVRLFGSAASCWFAPASGRIHASSPLHSYPACFAGCAARFRSPWGVFAPSGSKLPLASQPFGPPSGIARSSFAPRSLSIERFGCGSSFPIRYASRDLLSLNNQVTTFRNHFRGRRSLAACQKAPFRFHDVEFVNFFNSHLTRRSSRTPSPLQVQEIQVTSNPRTASPRFPFSHVSGKVPLSRRETKVTAFGEDYQRPATPERHTRTWRIP